MTIRGGGSSRARRTNPAWKLLINHFELFGLNQIWNHANGKEMAAPVFRMPLFYRQ